MFYNWKCCSFYPNNFGASALPLCRVRVSTGQWKHVYWPVETRPQASGRQLITEKKIALHLWLNLLVSFLSSLFIR